MKYKRSQIKKITLTGQVLKHMRKARGLSAANAGCQIGLSGPTITHYENGRMAVSQSRLEALVQAYGFTMTEFQSLMAHPPKAVDLRQTCIGLLDKLHEHQLKTFHDLLLLVEKGA
jgi:transcriptional regulator with XRE-family HTH domain